MKQCLHKFFFRSGFLFIILIHAGCYNYAEVSSKDVERRMGGLRTNSSSDSAILSVNSIGVAAPIFLEQSDVSLAARKQLAEQLYRSFSAEVSSEIYDLRDLTDGSESATSHRSKVFREAKAQGVDAVLVTTVGGYKERQGSALGSTSPAQVAFEVALFRTRDGARLWNASYSFRDKAVTDNIFDVRHRNEGGGAGWKRASKTVQGAFSAAARDLQTRRVAAFSAK